MLGAALDGIDNQMQTPKPLNNVNVYNLSEEERKAKNIKELPGSLLEALTELSKDMVLRDTLGEEIYRTFMRAKREEWEEYRVRVTDWEVEKFLEGA